MIIYRLKYTLNTRDHISEREEYFRTLKELKFRHSIVRLQSGPFDHMSVIRLHINSSMPKMQFALNLLNKRNWLKESTPVKGDW